MSHIDDLLTPVTCRHGGRAGRRPDGTPWCPVCRREEAAKVAEAEAREKARRDRRDYLHRLGWRNGRPPLDHKMRAAGEHPDNDPD